MICADPGMMEQVLMNLAVNARDAMSKGGLLAINVQEQHIDQEMAQANPEALAGDFACLSVSDTGAGIPAEVLPHIFEPFFTTKAQGKGTGLGLATVFGIVKQHQGWIRVYSEVGRGTTFRIYLPSSDASGQDTRGSDTDLVKPPTGTETILLVEDESEVRAVTRLILERHGYRVWEAANGLEAQRVWEERGGRAQLLLTDLVMPEGISGLELAKRLRAVAPKLRVVFTSGYSSDIAGQEFKLEEGQNFLQKPCPARLLLETIRKCLDA
jgi:CheY-like chemotaxis protein